MSNQKRQDDENNLFKNEIFVNSKSSISNDEEMVLEMDEKPWESAESTISSAVERPSQNCVCTWGEDRRII